MTGDKMSSVIFYLRYTNNYRIPYFRRIQFFYYAFLLIFVLYIYNQIFRTLKIKPI